MLSPLKRILLFLETLTIDPKISISSIMSLLRGQGSFCLLVFLTLPFLTPLQIPGFSTPFGILMGAISFRKIFYHKIWIPKFLANKSISANKMKKILKVGFKMEAILSKCLKSRLTFFTNIYYLKKANFLIISICSIILALPLPIPSSNLFFSWIILFISAGHLMNDGAAILLGDALFLIFTIVVIFLII